MPEPGVQSVRDLAFQAATQRRGRADDLQRDVQRKLPAVPPVNDVVYVAMKDGRLHSIYESLELAVVRNPCKIEGREVRTHRASQLLTGDLFWCCTECAMTVQRKLVNHTEV